MKVVIGKYKNWVGPYQIAEALCFWAKPQLDEIGMKSKPDWVHEFGCWLSENKDGSDSTLLKVCQWIESKRSRQVYVRIDEYDTWGMDHTLAIITVPLLKQLHATKHGAPLVHDEDVPDNLKSTSAEPKENEYDTDSNHFLRWDYVLEEMIWAFEQKLDDDSESKFFIHDKDATTNTPKDFNDWIDTIKFDRDGLAAHQARKTNGFRLFGKYYETLWD